MAPLSCGKIDCSRSPREIINAYFDEPGADDCLFSSDEWVAVAHFTNPANVPDIIKHGVFPSFFTIGTGCNSAYVTRALRSGTGGRRMRKNYGNAVIIAVVPQSCLSGDETDPAYYRIPAIPPEWIMYHKIYS